MFLDFFQENLKSVRGQSLHWKSAFWLGSGFLPRERKHLNCCTLHNWHKQYCCFKKVKFESGRKVGDARFISGDLLKPPEISSHYVFDLKKDKDEMVWFSNLDGVDNTVFGYLF